jgi:hypothetical protein
MVVSAGTTLLREPWLGTLSARGSTGQRRSPSPSGSCAPVKGANTTLGGPTYWLKHSRQSPSHGRSRSGDLIWSVPLGKRFGATCTCLAC